MITNRAEKNEEGGFSLVYSVIRVEQQYNMNQNYVVDTINSEQVQSNS
jgi:hypothetical protein